MFVPEDGTGLANANSYGSDPEFQAYWIERGLELTRYDLADRQVALVLATDHIELFWGRRFFGYKLTAEQALEFPRQCFRDRSGYLVEGVPAKLKAAQFEYAQRVLAENVVLAPDPTRDPSGQQIQATFKKVGPLEKRITYIGGSPRLLPAFPKADAYLYNFTWGAQGGSHRA